ncbi:hypothetical protein OIU84_023898 [Salix udensis]|uniref:Uncharacterized protein n=1 Tax=Salix udensis TaxID=889485 RepID=A0AAD6KRV0_9ROSI|nr:hypothetical protein OIU84_023898 [Salix udensis]
MFLMAVFTKILPGSVFFSSIPIGFWWNAPASCAPITSRLLKPAPASSSTACSFFEMMMRSSKTFNETLVDKYSPNPSLSSSRGYGFPRLITTSLYITTTSILFKGLRRRRIFLKQPTEDNDALSEALKAADSKSTKD